MREGGKERREGKEGEQGRVENGKEGEVRGRREGEGGGRREKGGGSRGVKEEEKKGGRVIMMTVIGELSPHLLYKTCQQR